MGDADHDDGVVRKKGWGRNCRGAFLLCTLTTSFAGRRTDVIRPGTIHALRRTQLMHALSSFPAFVRSQTELGARILALCEKGDADALASLMSASSPDAVRMAYANKIPVRARLLPAV